MKTTTEQAEAYFDNNIETKDLKNTEISIDNNSMNEEGIHINDCFYLMQQFAEHCLDEYKESLPNIYEKPHNTTRIKYYKNMAENWNISKSAVMHIFNDACDWYKSLI